MKSLIALAVAATLAATAAQAGVAPPSRIYEFGGNLSEQNGGPAATVTWGDHYSGSGATQGLKFATNDGPTIAAPFANPGVYSLEMFFSMDTLNGWQRIVTFDPSREAGIYAIGGDVMFYGYEGLGADLNFAKNQMLHMVFTRDAAGHFRAYAGGVEVFNVSDASKGLAVFGDSARLFNDRPGPEAGPGFVDFVRLYDRVLDEDEIGQLYAGGTPLRTFNPISAVPEPGTWALMIGGFGLTGAALRRRRLTAAAFA